MNGNRSSQHHTISRSRATLRLLLCALLLTAAPLSSEIFSQYDDLELAPPPLQVISREETNQLATFSGDAKKRTRLLIELMGQRVTAAEKLSNAKDHEAMFTELGGFHGLMDNGLSDLKQRHAQRGKVLDTFKRLEIGLRGFAPRLEAIRRELPFRYEGYVRRLIRYVREARTVATEPFFGDTVIPTEIPVENTPE